MSAVSRETSGLLSDYEALIRRWNPKINLVAKSTLDDIGGRHIQDCLQLSDASTAAQGSWVDIGSGGGLPGMVVAIQRPDLQVSMIESDQRKATFLRTVARELGLPNVKIVSDRIESVNPLNADHVSARALAPLPLLMEYVSRHLAPSGTAWLMKGRNWRAEVEEAQKNWRFDLIAHPSQTDPDAAILELTGIFHA